MSNLRMAERRHQRDTDWIEFNDFEELQVTAAGDAPKHAEDRAARVMEKILHALDEGVSLHKDLSFERDEFGQFVATDPVGAAVGTGASMAEAVEDWEFLANELLDEIEEFDGELHPRVARQRDYLSSTLR